MTRRWMCIAMLSLTVGCAHSHMNHHEAEAGGETPVTLDALPAPVRQTLERQAQGNPLTELEKEYKHGRTVYEAHAMVNGQNNEFHVSADGKLLKKEIEKKEEDND